MANTKIEWADAVWNPVTGCSPISEGCDHCYAKRMANRLKGRYGYDNKSPFKITEHPEKFADPCRTKKPKRFFVCSMGDMFHKDIEFTTIAKILWYAMTKRSKKHTFLFLTKRPKRMLDFFLVYAKAEQIKLPIKNFWLGVTAENQLRADERIPILLQIPAVVRFVSVEPMLGPVDLTHIPIPHGMVEINGGRLDPVKWVIIGQETGPGARPAKTEWFNSVIDQCKSAGVPLFVKKAPAGVPIIREFPEV